MPDKYDEAIAYLTEHPDEIYEAWSQPRLHEKAGCLFVMADGGPPWASACGCLTEIRRGFRSGTNDKVAKAPTAELTAAIQADKRIPKSYKNITVKSLPVFAEWQRRLDRELNRK